MKIKELKFNYVAPMMETLNGGERIDCYSEEYETAEIGKDGVKDIIEHRAMGEGDKWYYDIVKDEETIRTFAPYQVKYTN
jgi:hypothetical protein